MIEGSFRDVSLPALLQLLGIEVNKSFRIRVTDDSQKGYILVRRGWVIAAKFGILEGEDAICEFLSWQTGNFLAEQVIAQTDIEKNLRFDFQSNAGFVQDCLVVASENIGLNSEITGSQIFGSPEWKNLVKEFPLDRECFSVLAWLREGRKMRQALREFGFDIVRATAILSLLIRTQSIQVIRAGGSVDSGKKDLARVEYNVVPTTGGQQEAAAALAREAARALESADDVSDEAFMSKSFKSPEREVSDRKDKGSETSETNNLSYASDSARSSMEARLRARKNGALSNSQMPAYKPDVNTSTNNSPAAPTNQVEARAAEPEAKKPRPDLFTVLQRSTGRVVPDVGDYNTAGGAQATSSAHDITPPKSDGKNTGAGGADTNKNGGKSSSTNDKGQKAKVKTVSNQPAAAASETKAPAAAVEHESLSPTPSADSARSLDAPLVTASSHLPPSETRLPLNSPPAPSASPFSRLVTKIENVRASLAAEKANEVSPLTANWPKKNAESTAENTALAGPQGILQEFDQTMPSQPRSPARETPAATATTAPKLNSQAETGNLPQGALVVSGKIKPPEVTAEPAPAEPQLAGDDPRLIAKTQAMPLVAFDIERLLLTTFSATQFGKLALGNPSLDPQRRQTLMDAEYGKSLAASIEDGTRLPPAVLSSYRYCLDRGYIETHDPVIPLTADLLLGRMEIDQYLLQRRRITGDELRDLIRVGRDEGIKLTQLLVKSGYLTEADLETLSREQKRFAFK